MQTRIYSLKDCREYLDSSIEASTDGYNVRNSPWHRNTPGVIYVGCHSEKMTDPDFESSVVNIQRGEFISMTWDDKTS